jgi:hypothetical protein
MVSPTRKRNVSRLHQPPDMSLEAWPRELRKQFGQEPYFFAATGKSDFRIIAFTPFTRSTTWVTWKSVAALR